ncbi:MAG: hypothetical protein IT577_02000 [Verrucomicrobiae bacterium]|nr:hypothetical protein [Verrucomicrobiae bacterium]
MRTVATALLIMGVIHAASPCAAQDKIVNSRGEVIEGKIVKVTPSGAPVMRMGNVETAIPKETIRSIQMQPPPGLAEARKALAAEQYPQVLASIEKDAQAFTGLQVDWVIEALGLVADAYLATGKKSEAGAIYRKMETDYANSPYAVKAKVGLAKISVSVNRLPEAEAALKPILEDAQRQLTPPEAQQRVFADAAFVMGQLEEARGQKQEALENYMRVITLYPLNPSLVAQAEARVRALRADKNVFVK